MKSKIYTSEAPAPIGPYSQAVEANGFIFISGQIPIDIRSGEIVRDDVSRATRLVMQHIGNILKEAGSGWDKVMKTSIFLQNMDDFTVVNGVYASFFEGIIPPARETVQVAKLPKDVPVEISVIALK
jgi:2-iminobutanoate/2-iminopropanoate deaminase